jgi:hypothetical protein
MKGRVARVTEHGASQIDFDGLTPMRERHILDQAVVTVEARIIDQDIDAASEKIGTGCCPNPTSRRKDTKGTKKEF